MNSQHTEGKWKQVSIHEMNVANSTITPLPTLSHYGVHAIFRDTKLRRCTVVIADCHITAGREHEAEANARLITAAPDMLAALKELHAILDFVEPMGPAAMFDDDTKINAAMTRGLAAIRKAEGASE